VKPRRADYTVSERSVRRDCLVLGCQTNGEVHDRRGSRSKNVTVMKRVG
jgi:hypothetical protein